jgi:CTP synthase
MQKKGMIVSGVYPKKNLVEIVEISSHPWFVACQFHPEFQSRPENAHPLFRNFIKAALAVSKP